MSDNPQIVMVPKDLYYHEVAYVRGLEKRIEALEAAMRRAYDFLQDKSFTPDELTHECTKVLEVMEAALAPEQDK